MITVHFFASYREQLDCDKLTLNDGEHPNTLAQLKAQLALKGESWQRVMSSDRTLMAVNQVMTRGDVALNHGDEIAFFPPVTGG